MFRKVEFQEKSGMRSVSHLWPVKFLSCAGKRSRNTWRKIPLRSTSTFSANYSLQFRH